MKAKQIILEAPEEEIDPKAYAMAWGDEQERIGKQEFAKVTWSAHDIMEKAPKLTLQQAADWLHDNQRQIQDEMIERGWQTIENLLRYDGLGDSDEDDVEDANR